MEKLKPCPFCGGEASLFTTDEIGYLGSDRFTTKCNGCFCGTGHYAGPERAIEAWNRRAQPANEPLTWIAVNKRLPESDGTYIVYAPTYNSGSSSSLDCVSGIMFCRYKHGKWSIEHGYYKRPNCVTHWLPLPSKPEEGTK